LPACFRASPDFFSAAGRSNWKSSCLAPILFLTILYTPFTVQ
jgi:hypothetical protein